MLIKRLKALNQAGDTIVEVLVVLAVLSFAMAISMSTANKGLNQSRNALEHSQALGIVNSQVELLRSALSKKVDVYRGSPFCMKNNQEITPFDIVPPADTNVLDSYPGACTQGFYRSSIVYHSSPPAPIQPYFEFRVLWEGIGGLGRQQETLVYRIHKLTTQPSPDLVLGSPSPTSSSTSSGSGSTSASQAVLLMKAYLVNSCSDTNFKNTPYTEPVIASLEDFLDGHVQEEEFRHSAAFHEEIPAGSSEQFRVRFRASNGDEVCPHNVTVTLTSPGAREMNFRIVVGD